MAEPVGEGAPATANEEGDRVPLQPKAQRPKHGLCRCRHTTLQRIHRVCKFLFSMSTSYGFIMYLATNSNEPIMMSAIFGGFILKAHQPCPRRHGPRLR